ncbi:hypothetical protein [uncultured Methylobacterium sp.]|jgi:hypothetical protein|uniref:hypothetical protein n=1 Tax=uncultured Methylobacterium sp. TaxID=157278 RepID=UPI002611F35E|nr:hypothetical protein [uncultured Methylobacterium sp.]
MPAYRLRILRCRATRGGVDVHSEWLQADLADKAITQAKLVAERMLAGAAGIAMLSTESERMMWSLRRGIPKPLGLV